MNKLNKGEPRGFFSVSHKVGFSNFLRVLLPQSLRTLRFTCVVDAYTIVLYIFVAYCVY